MTSGATQTAPSLGRNSAVRFWPAIAEELPGVAHFADLVEVQVGDDDVIRAARALSQNLATRAAEIRLAVELADVPGGLGAGAVDAAHEVLVRDRVGGLLQLPEVFRKAGDRRRWVEHDLGPIQAQA